MCDANGRIPVAEVDKVLPRVETDPSKRLPLSVATLLGLLAIVVAVLLDPPAQFAAAVPAVAAVVVAVYPWFATAETLPQVSGADLQHFDQVDPTCIASHLVGCYGGTPRQPPKSEVVAAPISADNATGLKQIPDACARRWDEEGLHLILVGVPRANDEIVQEVAAAYDATLFIEDEDDVSVGLDYLPDLLVQPERDTLSDQGSMTVRQIPIEGRPPNDSGLRAAISKGRGKALSRIAANLRDTQSSEPDLTLVLAPPKYLEVAQRTLPSTAKRTVPVKSTRQQIEIVRFYMSSQRSIADRERTWQRASLRNGTEEVQPTVAHVQGEAPTEDAPENDRELSSRC